MLLIFKRLINFCWFCFKWALVPGVIAVAVAIPYFYDRVDEEIRCRVQQRIAQHYARLKVTVHSAELVEGKGIEVRGLSILEPGAEGPHAELIYCDEMFLHGATELQDLIRGELEVARITIRRPMLRATRRPDGTWSAAKLLPLPKFSKRPPEVTIENGTVEIFDPLKTPSSTLPLRDVNLTFSAPDTSSPTPHARMFQGTLSADHLRRVEVEGLVDPNRREWTSRGRIDGLDISPELRDALPGPLAAKLAVLGELRGRGTLSFRAGYHPPAESAGPSPESPYKYAISANLVRGRFDDPRLPYPLTDLRATIQVGNLPLTDKRAMVCLEKGGVVIDELAARSGQATIRLWGHQAGSELGRSPLALQAEIRQLRIDHQLLDSLPEALQEKWQEYRPSGEINADVKLSFDGQTWHPDLSVECLNVSLTHQKLPYRLDHGKGSLTWKETSEGDSLEVHLTAYSGSQEVELDAEVLHPNSAPTGWFEARGKGLQLDKKLLDALNEKPRAIVRSLNPSGAVDFYMRMWRDEPNQPLRKHLLIDLNRCSICYDRFPYPLGNIRGTIEMLDDHWTFRDLEGTNDTGRVACEEGWLTSPQQGRELYLRLVATNVPLEEELRDALAPNIQRVWDDLTPRGTVDLEEVVVRYPVGQKRHSVSVRAKPHPDTASIEPVRFPYRMERLRGVLAYRDGHVVLQGLKAEHGPVRLATSGHCDFLRDGRWNLHLEGLSVDGLRLDDRKLIQALPGRLKKAIVELKPGGQFDLRGKFDLRGSARVSDPVWYGWDLAIGFHRGSVDCGIKLENMYGSMILAGAFDGQRFHSRAELAIDSLTYKDYQFTEIMGPVWIDDRQVLLGSWVDDRRDESSPRDASQQPSRPLTAKLFGGTVFGDGWITLGPEPRYGLHATLSQADLSRIAREAMVGRQNLRGTILATVNLGGAGRSLNGLGGHGTIQLRKGDIYELPLMIALLKILSIRPPDQTAFSTSDVDFHIQGGHIYFDRINFHGDAISLLGTGEMDFQRRIRLNFHAIVGRGNLDVPVLKELFTGASQQILQIRVGGTLQNPDIRKEPFPVVNQALQQLQDDLQRSTRSPGLFPQARDWMPHVGGKSTNRR